MANKTVFVYADGSEMSLAVDSEVAKLLGLKTGDKVASHKVVVNG